MGYVQKHTTHCVSVHVYGPCEIEALVVNLNPLKGTLLTELDTMAIPL